MAAEHPQSRVFRQVVSIEVIAIAGPNSAGVAFDFESVVRDAVQANDTGTPDLWFIEGREKSEA